MRTLDRRHALKLLSGQLVLSAVGTLITEETSAVGDIGKSPAEIWMDEVLRTRALDKPLAISRFVEPMYYLLQPFTWTPNEDNGPTYHAVTVPRGFVTDLASIPRSLWSILPRDGDYAHAAILHDYLYWFQSTSREYADNVFRIAMRDLEVSPSQVSSIYGAVRTLGQSAWDSNARLRANGERRVLVKFPTVANTRWAVWKQFRDYFDEQS